MADRSELPELPDMGAISPSKLSLAELASVHRRLGEWLVTAESGNMKGAPTESEV